MFMINFRYFELIKNKNKHIYIFLKNFIIKYKNVSYKNLLYQTFTCYQTFT